MTSIQQSGHTVAEIRVDLSESWQQDIGDLMMRRETRRGETQPDSERVKKHDELLAKYNMSRSDVVLLNYNIEFDLVPHPNNPK